MKLLFDFDVFSYNKLTLNIKINIKFEKNTWVVAVD